MQRGDVVTVEASGDHGKLRSAVIVQTNALPAQHASVVVCQMTTDCIEAPDFRVTIEPSVRNGLKQPSQVMADKPVTIRRERVGWCCFTIANSRHKCRLCVISKPMWNQRQIIEIFHLLFLRAFGARVDKALYALKGGCNLRFFFKSIRYSEDMDLDIHTMSVGTLQNNVRRLLEAPSFAQALRAQGIEIARTSRPKQTETTQRWKLTLRLTDSGAEVPTKIEFSRRGLEGEAVVESVDAELIRTYRLYPVIAQHYSVHTAFAQKVSALALRDRVQSRDVFDLKLLLDAGGAEQPLPATVAANRAAAIDNALAVDYDAFAGQVLAFLDPEYQKHYGNRRVWAALQKQVVDGLGASAQ